MKRQWMHSILFFVVISLILASAGFWFDRYSMSLPMYHSYVPKRIGATYMTLNNPFFEIIDDSMRDQLEKRGYHLVSLDPALNLEIQIEQIEYFIEKDMDAIVINPVEYAGLKEVLQKAKKAKIPVFTIDTDVLYEDLVTYTISSDNYDAGVQCAKDLMKQVDEANILLLRHTSAKSAQERIQGFVDTIQKEPKYQIVSDLDCHGQLEYAMPLVENYLRQTPNVDCIMALNDPSALGALAALEAVGPFEDVLVYGVDGTPDTKRLIHEHRMRATVAQSPKTMGKRMAEVIHMYFQGKTIPSSEVERVFLITEENIDQYSLEGWQ